MSEIRITRQMSRYMVWSGTVDAVPVVPKKQERNLRRVKSMAAPTASKWTAQPYLRSQTVPQRYSTEPLL